MPTAVGARTALITGSTSGIGAAIADALEGAGATVVRHGLPGPTAEGGPSGSVTQELGVGPTAPFEHDLSVEGAGAALAADTLRRGPVDILVHAASVQVRAAWTDISPADARRQLQVNLLSAVELLQVLVPPMAERGWGRILAIGSVQQRTPHPQMAIYAATKAAQHNLLLGLAKQLAPSGITANTLSPGVIETPRNEAALSEAAYRARVLEAIPVGRIGRAEDLVATALLLCSDASGYLTGQDLVVDGGMSL
ncbi:SDR family oxidoreductase [Occultella glacieicola]|uniref:SDR family oxidoreductase n=1 Tax=Occultella glacieicola TaxID=2518684 RepID=A0ABY2DZF8_9MICO|nr:SDR family oxidoreductase [Occultella glacieicola]TDE89531.1 SDR family oxidoreductase [Occultella glacieicola]